MGFTLTKSSSILKSAITSGTYVALSSTTPTESGANFTEPSTTSGYVRGKFGNVDTSKSAQVANSEYIFIFEALSDCGTITHVGLSDNGTPGTGVFLTAKLTSPINVGKGYVPLIRPHQMIVALDKAGIESYG